MMHTGSVSMMILHGAIFVEVEEKSFS
jgi:hypothetical protein